MGNVNLQREAYWAYYLQTLCHGGLNKELQFIKYINISVVCTRSPIICI